MSRIGKKPVVVPAGVEVTPHNSILSAEKRRLLLQAHLALSLPSCGLLLLSHRISFHLTSKLSHLI